MVFKERIIFLTVGEKIVILLINLKLNMKIIKGFVILALVLIFVNGDDIFLGENHETGFIQIRDGLEMFYWLFKARNLNPNAPLVLWLPGI